MELEYLTPLLLLAASFAAGLSGLLVLAHDRRDIGRPGDAPMRNRHIARVLFVLGLSMLAWAAIWFLGQRASGLVGEAGAIAHKFFAVFFALVAGLAGYWKRRERAQKRDGR